jgi:hypothetical protein
MASATPINAFFIDGETARKATNLLTELGYIHQEISVSVTDYEPKSPAPKSQANPVDAASETQQETKAGMATGVMALIGAALGATIAIVGAMVATDGALSVLVPTAAGGAILGAGIGALFGGLLGSSVPAEAKFFFQQDAQEGRILIHVDPHSPEDSRRIRDEWMAIGGDFSQP